MQNVCSRHHLNTYSTLDDDDDDDDEPGWCWARENQQPPECTTRGWMVDGQKQYFGLSSSSSLN